jgi:hypothetical protein
MLDLYPTTKKKHTQLRKPSNNEKTLCTYGRVVFSPWLKYVTWPTLNSSTHKHLVEN